MRWSRAWILGLLAGFPIAAADPKPSSATVRVIAWPASAETHLTKSDWTAAVNGQRARAIRIHGPSDDLLILLFLDLTGDLNAADQAREAVVAAVNSLPSRTWVGVLKAQDGLQALADPAPDRTAALAAIQSVQVAGRAAFLEAAQPAVRLGESILRKTPVRAVVLFVTDASIYNYREDYTNPVINPSDYRDLSRRFPENLIREKTAKLAEELATIDAPLFVVQVTFFGDRLNEAYQNGVRQIAEATGGAAWFSRVVTEIPAVIAQAFERVQNHWALDLEIPPSPSKLLEVELKTEAGPITYRSRFERRR